MPLTQALHVIPERLKVALYTFGIDGGLTIMKLSVMGELVSVPVSLEVSTFFSEAVAAESSMSGIS